MNRWTSGEFKITEDPDSSEGAFRLDSLTNSSEWFGTWREAQRAATLKNELALSRADNERLRTELAEARGEHVPALAQSPAAAAAIAGKLVEAMAGNLAVSAPRGVYRRIEAPIGGANGNGRDADTKKDNGCGIPRSNGTAAASDMPL